MFTGEVHSGPRAETLTVPLERMPIFARAGAIVPAPGLRRLRRRAAPPDPLILNVYAGADGRFTLYEDEGVGFGYQQDQFTRTQLRWSEGAGSATLAIGPRPRRATRATRRAAATASGCSGSRRRAR